MTNNLTRNPNGLWLPLITPFRDQEVDHVSLGRLVGHYQRFDLSGIILAGTTGEAPTLSDHELRSITDTVAKELSDSDIPIFLGIGGNNTNAVSAKITDMADWPIDGFLLCCPAYSRPSQEGLRAHLQQAASQTARPVFIYNIPYRTGVNLTNDTLLDLAKMPNIIGVKDCSANAAQTMDLITRRDAGFSILSGEDMGFFSAICSGADGAVLCSAHVMTEDYVALIQHLRAGDLTKAQPLWHKLYEVAQLLFAEPSPGAVKYWLAQEGLIDSAELRLPMTGISQELQHKIDQFRQGL